MKCKYFVKLTFYSLMMLFVSACSLSSNSAARPYESFQSIKPFETKQSFIAPFILNKESQDIKAKLLHAQKEWKKTPYRLGGTSIKGADCSGFTQSIFEDKFNLKIPRNTVGQLKQGIQIPKKQLKTGDLVFFKSGRGPNGLHVGIYLSDNNFVHLSAKGGAKIANLENNYWKPKYYTARRYL